MRVEVERVEKWDKYHHHLHPSAKKTKLFLSLSLALRDWNIISWKARWIKKEGETPRKTGGGPRAPWGVIHSGHDQTECCWTSGCLCKCVSMCEWGWGEMSGWEACQVQLVISSTNNTSTSNVLIIQQVSLATSSLSILIIILIIQLTIKKIWSERLLSSNH